MTAALKRRLRAPQDFCTCGCADLAIDPCGRVHACTITCGDPAFVAGDLRAQDHKHHAASDKPPEHKTLLRALTLIFVADMSTSLDNVLAVAGVARDQPEWLLFAGLALSVALTGFAAVGVAKLLHRWPWIGYIGLVVVLYVAAKMVWDGAEALKWIRI